MRFVKLQGYGNDYIVTHADALPAGVALSDLVRRVCDRHYGPGSDGLALIGKAEAEGDFRVRIFNPDGSEAAMSGNGTRCAAAYLYDEGFWTRPALRLATRAGLKTYHLEEREGPGRYRFAAEIGRPAFESGAIPMRTAEPLERVVNYPLEVEGRTVPVTALQMCNPNCCVLVEDFDRTDWRRMGRAIESHERFPERTNVEFIRVRGPHDIEVRVWERGVGETLSSGTGACAAAVASIVNGRAERRVNVSMPGGLLRVEWREADGEVVLTGSAERVYRGEWLKE